MKSSEMLKIVKEMINKESEYSADIQELANRISNPILKALINGVAMESRKHSLFYSAIAELLSGREKLLSQEDIEILSSNLQRHIDMEKEMMELTHSLVEDVEDPRLKMILTAIYLDEIEHHRLLTTISSYITKYMREREEEFWNSMWRDSPWHGGPGG